MIAAIVRQVKWEQRQFWRNPPAAVFTVAFPLIFLFALSALFHGDRVDDLAGSPEFVQVYVPAIVAFGVITACYTGLGFTLCVRREQGVLKRKRGTPLTLGSYLGGMIANAIVLSALLTVVTIVSGVVLLGISWPQWTARVTTLLVTLLVAAFCFASWGIAISTFVPNQEAAPAVFNVILFPLLFVSGTFARVKSGSGLAHVAAVFPVWHLNKAVEKLFLGPPTSDGAGWQPMRLLVLGGWGLAGLLIAARRFRWEPSGGSSGSSGSRRRSRGRDGATTRAEAAV